MTTEPRLPVSVCMIAGAEAHRIRPALESVSAWAGEIIVVINEEVGDGTDQVAASCGARVFREPWKGHVAQKNSAVEKAVSEWVLGLDADEIVSPELRDEIRRVLTDEQAARGLAAFRFPRATATADAGFGTATGIPTGKHGSGAADRRAGVAWILTINWKSRDRSGRSGATCFITHGKPGSSGGKDAALRR